MNAALAGCFYFAIVFAAGFVLGAARTLWLAPAVGELAATLIELPVILGASWGACRIVVGRMKIAARALDRAVMGAVAFALLIAAEFALGLALMNRGFAAQIREMASTPGLIGLAGQVLFAAFPLIARRAEPR